MKISTGSMRWCALITLWCVGAAHAGTVTVAITSTGAVSPQDTIVILDPLDTTVSAAHAEATIDQLDKQFVPKVSVIRTGTAVTFSNSDHTRHQVYSFSPSKTFTLKLYAGSPETPVMFDKPGLVVLGCNIHDNMLAFVGVVDSPYFGKTSASGTVTLSLPAGRYRLRVWHPSLRQSVPSQEIAVTAAAMTVALTLDLTANAPGLASWPE